MFDNLHSGIASMRNELANSINEMFNQKFAVLESTIRDYSQNNTQQIDFHSMVGDIKVELHNYVKKELNNLSVAITNNINSDFIAITNNMNKDLENLRKEVYELLKPSCEEKYIEVSHNPNISNNIVIERKEAEVEVEEDISDVEVEEEAEEEMSEEEKKFSPLNVGDKTYMLDEDFVVYKETDEGLVEIGTYDPETGELDIEDEDEEEAVVTTEFTYKGKTYLRDEDNNVYNQDGEEIGIWTGSVVKFSIRTLD